MMRVMSFGTASRQVREGKEGQGRELEGTGKGRRKGR